MPLTRNSLVGMRSSGDCFVVKLFTRSTVGVALSTVEKLSTTSGLKEHFSRARIVLWGVITHVLLVYQC